MKRTTVNPKRPVKNRIKENFTIVANSVITDPELSWKAKGIFTYIACRPEGWKFNMEEIMRHAPDGISALRSGVKELEERGYLVREAAWDVRLKKFNGWEWALSIPELNSPTEKQYYRKAVLQKSSSTANRHDVSNTEFSNTEFSNTEEEKELYPLICADEASLGSANKIHFSQFDQFWKVYPKKAGKPAAQKSWKALSKKKHRPTFEKILQALHQQMQSEQWQEITYIPHPATWLNQERWEDDPKLYTSTRKPKKPMSGHIQKTRTQFKKDGTI